MGVREQFIGPEPPLGVSDKCLTLEFKQWLTAEYKEEWQATKNCRQTKTLMKTNLNPVRKAEFRKLNRKEAKILTKLLIGHDDLHYHRVKTGIVLNAVSMKKMKPRYTICSCEGA